MVVERVIETLIDVLATFRLTRLVTTDTITAEVRDGVIEAAYRADGAYEHVASRHLGEDNHPGAWADYVTSGEDLDPPKIATLVTCPWCAGMWVALLVVALRRIAPGLWRPLGRALALSGAAGLIALVDE